MKSPIEVHHIVFDFTEVVPKERDSSFIGAVIGGILCLAFLYELDIIGRCILIWMGQ